MAFAELIIGSHQVDDDGIIDTLIDTHAWCTQDSVIVN